jgi:hypothetical protein
MIGASTTDDAGIVVNGVERGEGSEGIVGSISHSSSSSHDLSSETSLGSINSIGIGEVGRGVGVEHVEEIDTGINEDLAVDLVDNGVRLNGVDLDCQLEEG